MERGSVDAAGSKRARRPASAAATDGRTRRSGPPDLRALLTELRAVRGAVTELAGALAREHERAAHRETVIDRLHAENQELRKGELDSVLEPVRTGLYRLHDLVRREAERWASPYPANIERVAPLLNAVAEEIVDVLARAGVEAFEVAVGDPYDSSRHRPMDTLDVADETYNGAVVQVLTCGFTRGARVVRRADVIVGQRRSE